MSGSTPMEHILLGTMSDARLWRHGSQLSLPITFDVALTDWMKEDGITPLAYITKLSIRLANATLIARCGYSTAWHVWGRCSRFATLPPPPRAGPPAPLPPPTSSIHFHSTRPSSTVFGSGLYHYIINRYKTKSYPYFYTYFISFRLSLVKLSFKILGRYGLVTSVVG